MFTFKWVAGVVSAVCCALVLTASRPNAVVRAPHQRSELSFSRAVSLPGVTLPAGGYQFELVDGQSGLVLVRARRGGRVLFLGFTTSETRGAHASRSGAVTLDEAARGGAPRIRTWYPSSAPAGRRFIYKSLSAGTNARVRPAGFSSIRGRLLS